ncbi:GPI ethanolamine phosphate transferase 1 [Drosophila gunungcola]|uniref:GPI ethanolamine phosphate transferase 1 n=1 Tax=Drosophila gunungcola TaxID=103775 RepID=UPI0022E4553E|nr:GPI ethanolamine phosphate transferase 1 [Drosophila gunungcola]
MWKVQALVVHLLLMGSILSTYFQPTLLPNLVPQKTLRDWGFEPPADRLVVFLTDGLRAATFLANNGSDVPDLRDIFRKQGRIGISRTCAPTMTRPGHIAIFGGFDEDPAAALVNFRYNPSKFDTVFNRSRNTIGWAHRNVVNFFINLPHGGAPLRFESYMERELPEKLTCDKWTFEKVQKFFKNGDNVREFRHLKSVVFFVYLGDMDIAAHRFKPLSKKFNKKLQYTQRGIRTTYELFERVFNDSRTAYLLTSDHGMSDEGIHGGGSALEVETPLFMWGAGVNREQTDSEANFPGKSNISELDQTQLAPLMSALIGLPPPMNNLALMPVGYLNVSAEYEVMALHLNVLQLMCQAEVLIQRFESAIFFKWLPKFMDLDLEQINQYASKLIALKAQGNIKEAMETCQKFGKSAQKCLAYYHNYYFLPLMVATTLSYLIWFYCLILQLNRLCKEEKEERKGFATFSTLILVLLGIVFLILFRLQNVSHINTFYLLLPVGMLIMAQAERPTKSGWTMTLTPIWHFSCILLPAGLLILMTFVYRHLWLLYAVSVLLNNRRAFLRRSLKFFIWLALVSLLCGMLFLLNFKTVLKRLPLKNYHVLYISMLLAIFRPLILGHRHDPRVWAVNSMALIAGAIGVYQYEVKEKVSVYIYAATWSFLLFAFLSIRYFERTTSMARRKLELITINMVTIITLLSTSWGSLNVQIVITEFVLGLQVYEDSRRSKEVEDLEVEHDPLKSLKRFYRYAFMTLLYFYVAFSLAGHWLSTFLFKSTTARLFYPHFSLYLSGSLLILKIFLPSLIVISALYAMVPFFRKNTRAILICVFLISDAMGLYMYYFVRNRGTWPTIRKFLDQALLTHAVNFMLLGCVCLAKIFLANTAMEKPGNTNVRSTRRNSSTEDTRI